MKRDKKVMVIAASTPLCIGFNAENRAKAGSQFMDVGIAEQNGITIAAAMAKYGCKPVFATNSTFIKGHTIRLSRKCVSTNALRR